MTGHSRAALEVYARNGAALAARYAAVDADAVFAPLVGMLPPPGRMLDVGAGTGRDAAWFATRGFSVTAVEPTDSLRHAGEAHTGAFVTWCTDTLPQLGTLAGQRFDFILVNAVWHHLDPSERDLAIARLAALARPGGRLLISLRRGPDLPGQPVARMEPEAEIARATAAGLALVARRDAASEQTENRAAGVSWSWLALQRATGDLA